MQENSNMLLEELKRLLRQKKSKQFYADKLGVSVQEVDSLLEELRQSNTVDSSILEEAGVRHNLDKGTIEVLSYYDKAPQPEDIIRDHNIDVTKFKLSNYWSKQKTKGYQVSAYFSSIGKQDTYSKEFTDFIKDYKTDHKVVTKTNKSEVEDKNACLIFNKQDAHLNKLDVRGDNDLGTRFFTIEYRLEKILRKAQVSANLQKVIYIIGSDQLNSEHTGMTTKGTPQQNAVSYHEGFQLICDHETNMINLMLSYSDDIEVIYVPGNHDEFAGWHVINWLKAYFKNQKNVTFETSPEYTKYVKFDNTAIMFNHGDAIKPEKLAQIFPIGFKKHWSQCDFFYVMTGDKHTELSRDLGGIKFYQIPALSNSKSWWDIKNGYTSTKAEMTAFLITEGDGMSDIYKETI